METNTTNITKKKVVLAIEDDAVMLEIYRRKFELSGFSILVAEDGEKGLNIVKQEKPDCVVLDIRMPKMDGFEVLKAIRENDETKNIPVIILTNFDLAEYRAEAEKWGVSDYLIKANVDADEVVKRIKDITG